MGTALLSALFLVLVAIFATTANGLAIGEGYGSVTFRSGGVELEKQDLPDFLLPYHSRSLELTESAFDDPSLICTRAVQYGSKEHQLLDVWASSEEETGEKARPVVVFIHGGGWDWGYREWVGFCSQNVCRDGQAIMVAPSYSLGIGKNCAWPNSRDDIVEVLRWIASQDENGPIAKAGGDPSKIILAGHSAGGHLAACVGLNEKLLTEEGIDPKIIQALFLVSCPLGVCAEDFFPALSKNKWRWWVFGPFARALYKRSLLKFLRPVVGSHKDGESTKETIRRFAEDASPLFWLDQLKAHPVPFVHYSYATKKDFPICRQHSKSLVKILDDGDEGSNSNNIEILEMLEVEGHFDSHFSLADSTSEWHDALTKIISSSAQ